MVNVEEEEEEELMDLSADLCFTERSFSNLNNRKEEEEAWGR